MDPDRLTEKAQDAIRQAQTLAPRHGESQIEASTLAGVMDDLDRRGFTEHFTLRNGRLCALGASRAFGAADVEIAEYHRFEGVSDPDDMSILYAIETRSGLRGTLADAFGVYSDPSVGDFVEDVAVHRD